MVIPKQTDFEMYKIYSVHRVAHSNDSVIGIIAASNGGLHLHNSPSCMLLYTK